MHLGICKVTVSHSCWKLMDFQCLVFCGRNTQDGCIQFSNLSYLFSLTSVVLFLNRLSFTGKRLRVASHTCNRMPLSICYIRALLLKWNWVVNELFLSPFQALSGEMSPFLCSGSHQAQRDCQPSALNCFVEAMSQCVPPIPIRPCVLKYLGKTHNLWLRSTLMLEQQAFEKGLSLHSKPKQSTEFYEQESITPPQQVVHFDLKLNRFGYFTCFNCYCAFCLFFSFTAELLEIIFHVSVTVLCLKIENLPLILFEVDSLAKLLSFNLQFDHCTYSNLFHWHTHFDLLL